MKTQKMFASLGLAVTMLLTLASTPAFAENNGNHKVVYNNGTPDGNNAYIINFGFTVTDSFTLNSQSNINHIDFWVWQEPGDVLESVDYTIYSLPPARILAKGTASTTPEDQFQCLMSQGLDCEYGFSFSAINLPAGTYWLTLGNAVVNTRDPIYWAESGGPSKAFQDAGAGLVGTIPSEAFDVVDPPAQNGSVSQPGSTSLFDSGLSRLTKILSRIVGS